MKKKITNDRVDNVSRDDEFDQVCGQVHVLVQNVDALHLALEVLLFVMVKERLVGSPRLSVLLQTVAIVEGSERLREIFDGRGCLSLATQTTTNLHIVSTVVDVEKAPHGHISFGILGDNLQVELQGMLCLEWGQFHGTKTNKNVGPY